MGTFTADQRLILRLDDLVWREVQDEVVVLEVTTATYLTLNSSAKLLWLSLSGGATVTELASALVDRFGISDVQAEKDVREFLDVLEDRSLLQAVT